MATTIRQELEEEFLPAGRAATRQRRYAQFPALQCSVVRDDGGGP
jgi:hypothetical protein